MILGNTDLSLIFTLYYSGFQLWLTLDFCDKLKKKSSLPVHCPPRPQNNQIRMSIAWDSGISVLSSLPGDWVFGVSRWYYLSGLLHIRFQDAPWRFWSTRCVWGTALDSTCHTSAPGDSYKGVWEMCLSCSAESETPIPSKTAPTDILTSVSEPLFHALNSNLTWVFLCRERELTLCYMVMKATALRGSDCCNLPSTTNITNYFSHSLSTMYMVLSAPNILTNLIFTAPLGRGTLLNANSRDKETEAERLNKLPVSQSHR